MFIIDFSIALNKTPYTDCYRVGAHPEGYLGICRKTLLRGGLGFRAPSRGVFQQRNAEGAHRLANITQDSQRFVAHNSAARCSLKSVRETVAHALVVIGKPLRDLCEACAASCSNAPSCSNTSLGAPPHCAGRSRLVTGYVGVEGGACQKEHRVLVDERRSGGNSSSNRNSTSSTSSGSGSSSRDNGNSRASVVTTE